MPGSDGKSVFSLTIPRGRKSGILPDDDYNLEMRRHLPAFEELLDRLPFWLTWSATDHAEYNAWRWAKARELFNQPQSIFTRAVSVGDSKRTPDCIKKAIAEFYKNQFSNVYKKAHPDPANTAPPTLPNTFLSVDRGDCVSSETFTNTISGLRRARLLLRGEMPAKEAYVLENEDEIQTQMNTLKTDNPSLEGGALRNMAIKRLWDNVDKSVWIAKVNDRAANIAENQQAFPWLMKAVTSDTLCHGLVGDCIVKLSISCRNEHGALTHSMFHVGFDAARGALFNFAPVDEDIRDEECKAWEQESWDAFPQFRPNNHIDIPTTIAGVPIFPPSALNIADNDHLKQIIKAFFSVNYKYSTSSPDEPPLEDIAKDPGDFIDTSIFSIPTNTLDPKTAIEIRTLAFFLTEQSKTDHPFVFRTTRLSTSQGSTQPRTPSPTPTIHEDLHPELVAVGGPNGGAADAARPPLKTPTPAASFVMDVLASISESPLATLSANHPPLESGNPQSCSDDKIPGSPATNPPPPIGQKRKRKDVGESGITEGTGDLQPPGKKPKAGSSKQVKAKENINASARPRRAVRNKAQGQAPSSAPPASSVRPPHSGYAKKKAWKGYVLQDERGVIVPTDENGKILPGAVDENGLVIDATS